MNRPLDAISRRLRLLGVAMVPALLALVSATGAAAAPAAAHWAIVAQPSPTYFHPGDSDDFYEIFAVNDGGATSSGETTFSDTLPKGLTVTAFAARAEIRQEAGSGDRFAEESLSCGQTTAAEVVTVTCPIQGRVPPGRQIQVRINVEVPGNASGELLNSVSLSGGGASTVTATTSSPVTSPSEVAPFGASLPSELTEASGAIATQAGSHPFAFTNMLAFNVASVNPARECPIGGLQLAGCGETNAEVKDLEVALPPGLVGNPTAVPRCTQALFHDYGDESCPASTQVGDMWLQFFGGGSAPQYAPIYNVEPPTGQPAELGFTVAGVAHIPMFFHVRSDGDYGLSADLTGITQIDIVREASLTIWGVPADPAHNGMRISAVAGEECGPENADGCAAGTPPRPFLTMPTSCSGAPLSLLASGDSWTEPGPYRLLESVGLTGTTGCGALSFSPSISLQPGNTRSGSPSGYNIHIDVPQHEGVEELATPDVRDVSMTLPQGTVLSPSASNGLQACGEAQFGRRREGKGECPSASKVGNVKVTTPLLEQPLKGSLYIGTPECSPCSPAQAESGQMVRLLLEAEGSGVTIKLAGHTAINQQTGQLTATFTENPQLPFSDLEIALEEGPLAPLANPIACGPASATAQITPWSGGTAAQVSSTSFQVGGCGAKAFTPSVRAGMTESARGGSTSAFALTLSRPDGQADLGALTVHTPPGLLGYISHVTPCDEAEANAGTCPASSQIGESTATVGPGSQPFTVNGGKVFLTGPYRGQPYGLSIVTPAEAGPFKLSGNTGNGTEVVRASIAVNPETTALTIASEPLPTALDGIPLRIDQVVINVNRPEFMLNPTNCDAMSINSTISSAGGAVANQTTPFQAVNCANLAFKPSLKLSLKGSTKRIGHPALKAVVTYPKKGAYANIARAQVNLPHAEFLDQGNLNKTCTRPVLLAGNCPAKSIYGKAKAWSPLLETPLEGPVYLVGGYGYKLPALVAELNGQIRVVLKGKVDSGPNHGIRNTFEAVPDAPVSRFVLEMKGGPKYGLLENSENLCKNPQRAIARFTAQNAAVDQFKPLVATQCGKKRSKSKKTSSK